MLINMKDNERSAVIYVATDEKQFNVTFFVGETIEDLCIKVCIWMAFFLLLDKAKFYRSYDKKRNFSDLAISMPKLHRVMY